MKLYNDLYKVQIDEELIKQLKPKKYYIVTNYITQGQYGVELNGLFKKYFDGLNVERWYVRSNSSGIWFETQYLTKENAEILANRLNADGLLNKLVEE
jgi:N-acetylmuramoyl-L-alanine amidase